MSVCGQPWALTAAVLCRGLLTVNLAICTEIDGNRACSINCITQPRQTHRVAHTHINIRHSLQEGNGFHGLWRVIGECCMCDIIVLCQECWTEYLQVVLWELVNQYFM